VVNFVRLNYDEKWKLECNEAKLNNSVLLYGKRSSIQIKFEREMCMKILLCRV
jgi:hypothetical protein